MPESVEKARDWYLREWVTYFGKKQAALVNELDWDKSTANFLWHGKQRYRRDHVNEVAAWLGIEPYELLMPPHQALALRRLRETAATIVAESPPRQFEPAPAKAPAEPKRTGTKG